MFSVFPLTRLEFVPPLGPVQLWLVKELLQVVELGDFFYLILQGTTLVIIFVS